MKTTVYFPDDMFRQLKSLAALRGMSMRQILQKAVADELANAYKADVVRDKVNFPILDSKEPGSLHLTNSDIEDLLT